MTCFLRFLEIDPKAWPGVEKTAATSDPKHHIGAVRFANNAASPVLN
jgi:hypothetical protein